MTPRLRRSALYLPAANARAIEKARALPCDVVILDLEDAVAPDAKVQARDQAVAAVRGGGFGGRELVVRVNGLGTAWGRADIAALAPAGPDAILVPKIDGAGDIAAYAAAMAPHAVPLWCMIETARALFRLDEIAGAPGVAGLVIGTNDLAKETTAQLRPGRAPFLGMLGLAVAAARAHGIAVLDGVYNDIADTAGFAAEMDQAIEFGFDGKTLIHPSQIDPCNVAFRPDATVLDFARRIIAAFALAENAGKGAIRIDGKMVERLHLAHAQRTVALAAVYAGGSPTMP